jgi:hypothetical protein
MKIQIELLTNFGNFKSEISEIEDEKIEQLKEMSKGYFRTGLELDLEDGSFAIFSPEVIKNSILKINRNV